MPGPPHQHRTPYWYRHSYHQPNSLQFFAPHEYVQQAHQNSNRNQHKDSNRFTRQKSNRERARPNSISDLHYSLESSPASSVPSKSSTSSSDTSCSTVRTDSQSSSDITNLDQSCSSLPSQSGESSNTSSPEQDFHESQIPVWKRNGKFVNFFRSFMGSKPNKEKAVKTYVFGTELTKLLADTGDEVPQVLRICTQFIEEHGIINGIYRASGISSNIQRIKTLFDEQRVPNLAGDSAVLHDIHCVSSVLKLYFRDLPTPLVTYDLYPHLVLASKQAEPKRGEKYREILQRLPQAHYRTMDWLMRHLYRMSLQSERTGMTSKNLAIVWSPNILRCDVSELDTQDALQDVGLQAVITEFLIRCSSLVFAPSVPSVLSPQSNPSHCIHCCCHCDIPKQQDAIKDVPPGNHTVTFAKNTSQTTQLKPVLKNSESNSKKVELRVNNNPNRPRPRSVAVPNPATAGHYQLEEVKLVSLPARQTAELVDVPVNSIPTPAKSDSNGNVKPSVTFHTVLDKPTQDKKSDVKQKKAVQTWRNIFHIQPLSKLKSGHDLRGSHREINIDDAILPENKPLNYRPRPRSELNLSYSIQDSTLMLTPMKNNEFQVTTTNQFSYLPYQQNLLNYNKQHQFTRTNKLRQNFNKREHKQPTGPRPKSVDFEVLQSLENICRSQPLAYAPGIITQAKGSDLPLIEDRRAAGQLRASQREKLKDNMVGEWQNLHATRV